MSDMKGKTFNLLAIASFPFLLGLAACVVPDPDKGSDDSGMSQSFYGEVPITGVLRYGD